MTDKKSKLPEWKAPDESKGFITGLRISNTLTLEKNLFVPQEGKLVKYYLCGPTVYDSSHMGHARTYLALDIIRRIMEDYFGYNMFVVMNITDIDDKIILKARQNALLAHFKEKHSSLNDSVRSDVLASIDAEVARHEASLAKAKADDKMNAAEKKANMSMYEGKISAAQKLRTDVEALKDGSPLSEFWDRLSGPLAPFLDARGGVELDMQTLFREHAARFEREYVEDMEMLGIRPPDVMTRVSEYLDEVVKMTQQIIDNGYGYEANGSVYFDTQAFSTAEGHDYGKLEPWSVGDDGLLADGEGVLGGATGVKRHRNDFALWKGSKPGEPHWSSPWGEGRPGWHIECSAMAASLIEGTMDMHAGGMDLKFPHHDNEIAQAEAYYQPHVCNQWVNYFLHTGHLHIEGLKMSKSLKNFVTIRQALESCTARQMRMLFLLRSWENVMNYSAAMLEEVRMKEKTFTEFFLLVKQIQREQVDVQKFGQRWEEGERKQHDAIITAQKEVDEALKDNFDTPRAMRALFDLVNVTNVYARSSQRRSLVMEKTSKFVERILRVFGVIPDSARHFLDSADGSSNSNDAIEPLAGVIAQFRHDIREAARSSGGDDLAKKVQALCDAVRDEALPALGVRLEDDPNFPAAFKIVDAAALQKEIAEKKENEAKARLAKVKARIAAMTGDLERARVASADPTQMYRSRTSEFGSFDDAGMPLTTAEGEPLAKGPKKKLAKEMKAAVTKHQKWVDKGGASFTASLEKDLEAAQNELKTLTN